MPKPLPPQEELEKLLEYDPETGGLTWKERPREMFLEEWHQRKWNTRYAGQPALTSTLKGGYKYGNLFDQKVLAHRVIWKMVTGEDPQDVDHIDGNRWNNRK